MATCPNKGLQEWKDLVVSKGEDIAYFLWDQKHGEKSLVDVDPYALAEDNARALPFDELELTSRLIENKLKTKIRPFYKRNKIGRAFRTKYWYNSDSYLAFEVAKELMTNIIGKDADLDVATSVEGVKKSIIKFFNQNVGEIWRKNLIDIYNWQNMNEGTVSKLHADKRTIIEFLRRNGENLEGYSKENQLTIRTLLKSYFDPNNKYKTKKQGLYLAGRIAIKSLDKKISKETYMDNIFLMKKNAIMNKYTSLFNLSQTDPDYRDRIKEKIFNEIDRVIEYKNKELKDNPSILDVIKFRFLYNQSGFQRQGMIMENQVKDIGESVNIDKYFDNINVYAETGEVVGESTTPEILTKISNSDSKLKDIAIKLLPFAERHSVSVAFYNKIPGGHSAGKYNAMIGRRNDGNSFIEDEDVLIDYTSYNYKADPESILVHEITHSLTSIVVASDLSRSKQKGEKNPLTKYLEYLQKQGITKSDINPRFMIDGPYGFSNEAEMIAEAMSNSYFQEMLKNIPAMNPTKYSNLFMELMDWISNLFKITKASNAYEQLLEITDGLLNKQIELELSETENLEKENILLNQKAVTSYQLEGTESSKASPETIEKVKEAAKKMGISFTDLATYLKGNPDINSTSVNALADLTRGIIAISQGKEDVALIEEMVHVATAILEQTNPSLIKEMITKITKFKIYQTTLDAYKDNKAYQLENGKPDIRKIKKEAVDKLITELIIEQNQGTTEYPELLEEVNRSMWRGFWQKVLNFFNINYQKANIDIFSGTAEQVLTGEIGRVEDYDLSGIYFQLSDKQKDIQRRILDTKNYIEKREKDPNEDDTDPMYLDTEKINNWYEIKNADGTFSKITKRVTDRVKQWYRSKFDDKDFTDKQKALNEFKRDEGTRFHLFFEEIHGRYFNPDGTRKSTLDPRPVMSNKDRQIYSKLEKYFVELIDSYSQDGQEPLVLSEAILYDPKEKEPGTVDLIIVEPDGKTHIYDWKFLSVAAGAKDVAWFKQGAYNIQLKTYRKILQSYYGVEQIGKNRAIPILLDIRNRKKGVGLSKVVTQFVNDIEIGSVNPADIEDLKLLPISEKHESTEIPEIDKLLKKLNAVHSRISSVKVASEEEKEFKKQRLNVLKEAVRIIQGTLNVDPLVDVISIMKREGENIINDYNTIFKNAEIDKFSEKELSDFAETLQDYMAIGEAFGTIGDDITDLFYNKEQEKLAITKQQKEDVARRKDLADKIHKESREIRLNTEDIKELAGEFADKFVGRRNLVTGLLDVAKEIKSLGSLFRGVSELGLAATDVLFKVVSNSKANAARDAYERVQKLMGIRKRIMARSGDPRKLLNSIYQKTKDGKKLNELIYKYDKRFYKTIDDLAQDSDRTIKALKTYIDVNGYMKEANEMLKKRRAHIRRSYTDANLIDKLIIEEEKKYNINDIDFNGFSNNIIKKHPKDDWISEEYIKIQEDKDLFELYTFISETNQKANKIGYIQNKVKNTFLPFIRKGFAESVAWDFSLSAVKRLADDLTVRPDDIGYGAIDDLTKEVVNTIPKYYTHDFSRQEDGSVDMVDVSEDLFKNLALYVTHVERYKYLSEVEGQLTLVQKIESYKNSYQSSSLGYVVEDPNAPGEALEQAGNKVNYKIYTNFLNSQLYDQKYPVSTSDIGIPGIGKAIEFGKQLISTVTGRKYNPKEANLNSLMKTIDAGNRYFQLKTLGFAIISGAANLFGTTIQMSTQAGIYFKSREFGKNAMKLLGNRYVNNDERKMFVQLVDAFMPLKDDPNYEKIKQAGMTKLTQENFSDLLMVFMRQPEFHVEKSIFLTLLDNSMVNEEGRIVNILEHVKSKYPNRNKSASEYRTTKRKIKAEITKLKQTKSITKTKKLVDGKLVIPGLDMTNKKELQRLTSLTRRLSRNATGSLSDSDINQINMSIFGKSAMVFKGWIPKLVDTRFGEFRKVGDDFSVVVGDDGLTTGEKYDIGRVRLLGYVLGTSIRDKAMNITNILQFNDKGILALDKMYEDFAQKHMKRTGKKLIFNPDTGEYINFITKDQFVDLIRTNLRNQIKELGILLTLFAVTVAIPPPDDDMNKAEKNFYRFTEKVINRFVSELMFFYNPAEFKKMLGGSAFPVLGIAGDIGKFISHTTMELTGLDIYNPDLTKEEVYKKAQPIKYGAKMVPFAKELLNYGAMIDEEFAKEFDINITTNRNR